jgi:hypothetical protein
MGAAFIIQYSGIGVGTMYKIGNTIYLTLNTTTTPYLLTSAGNDTLTELVAVFGALDNVTCTLVGTGTDASTLINDISINHKADIKTNAYTVGYNNYTSPQVVCDILARAPEELQQSWFDNVDAEIEKLTGYKFRSATYSGNLDIKYNNIRTNNDYEYYTDLFKNAYFLDQYAPVTALSALTVDSTTVTPTYVKIDRDTLILTSDAEATRWIPGIAKATATLTYGYATTTNEGKIAKELATLLVCGIYHGYDLMAMTTNTINRIDHMGVTLTSEGYPVDLVSFEREKSRVKELMKVLPKKFVWRTSNGV